MNKYIISFITIMSFFFYVASLNKSSVLGYVGTLNTTTVPTIKKEPLIDTPTPSKVPTVPPPTKTPPKTPTPTPKPTPVPVTPPKPQGIYKDGSYTGNSTDAYYGYIQVKAIITDGKISNVVFLDYPQDRNTSREISAYAMPRLKIEAIQAQSANVDIVSGATHSSQAFRKSLASALLQAKI